MTCGTWVFPWPKGAFQPDSVQGSSGEAGADERLGLACREPPLASFQLQELLERHLSDCLMLLHLEAEPGFSPLPSVPRRS